MIHHQEYEDHYLVELVANGDRSAFTQLYTRYLGSLYNYVYLFTRSKATSEEILQDVFIKIWEQREKLLHIESFKNYLFRSAKNKLVDHLRHEQIKSKVLLQIKRNSRLQHDPTNDDFAYREYYHIVQLAIEKLPPKRKLIFRLSTENGLSLNEIAEKLRLSKSTVKNQLYISFNFVKEYLAKYGGFIAGLTLLFFILRDAAIQ